MGSAQHPLALPTSIVCRLVPGDADGDGDVDLDDFAYLLSNFGQTGKVWCDGDFDGDGDVDLDDFSILPDLMKAFAKQKIELIAISGGDGTVQAVQTALAATKSYKSLPRLAILPHGTTNMTAADVGLRIASPDRVAELLGRPSYLRRATAVKVRRSVKVSNLLDTPPQHGMFFGNHHDSIMPWRKAS